MALIDEDSGIGIALLPAICSTFVAPAGFLLVAFGVIGTGGALVPFLLASSSCLTLTKIIHIQGLQNRKTSVVLDFFQAENHMYTALQRKEAGTAVALGATTVGAGILTTHSAASAIASVGILHPALSLVALGFAINALVECYDNIRQWQDRVKTEDYYTKEEEASGFKKAHITAARNLALSSFVKLLGWSCVVAGGFALAAPFAAWLIPGGLALVALSHAYNNCFSAAPRAIETKQTYSDSLRLGFLDRIGLNSCRGKHADTKAGKANIGLQLL